MWPTFSLIWALVKKSVFFALTLLVVQCQITNWDDGRHEREEVIELSLPETDATLKVFSKRSNPIQPEFDRRLEIHTPGKPVDSVELRSDTSGANVVDLYLKREQSDLRVYLTSPYFYGMEERSEPRSAIEPYPGLSDEPSTATIKAFEEHAQRNPNTNMDPVQMARLFPRQKFWVLFDGKVPLSDPDAASAFEALTHYGHFDTRKMTWNPAESSPSEAQP